MTLKHPSTKLQTNIDWDIWVRGTNGVSQWPVLLQSTPSGRTIEVERKPRDQETNDYCYWLKDSSTDLQTWISTHRRRATLRMLLPRPANTVSVGMAASLLASCVCYYFIYYTSLQWFPQRDGLRSTLLDNVGGVTIVIVWWSAVSKMSVCCLHPPKHAVTRVFKPFPFICLPYAHSYTDPHRTSKTVSAYIYICVQVYNCKLTSLTRTNFHELWPKAHAQTLVIGSRYYVTGIGLADKGDHSELFTSRVRVES